MTREGGPVQFYDPSGATWDRIGYEVVNGDLGPGRSVTLRRAPESTPDYFTRLLNPEDAVVTVAFNDREEQALWVAESIERDLTEGELQRSDILIIFPEALTAIKESEVIKSALEARGITSHLAGVTTSTDVLFVDDSIAMTGIFRAKGNEAPMVYVSNSQYGFERPSLIRRRNTLFTAITRSNAWVRICGWGDAMKVLAEEISKVKENNYQLSFNVPTEEEIRHLKQIYRDILSSERETFRQAERLAALIEAGDLSIDNIPRHLRQRLERVFGRSSSDTGQ